MINKELCVSMVTFDFEWICFYGATPLISNEIYIQV